MDPTMEFSRSQIVALLTVETEDEEYTRDAMRLVDQWIARGDGCAVYRNEDLGHPDMGRLKFVSFGSPSAQLVTEYPGIPAREPPDRLPDIGTEINWRFVLIGTYRKKEA